MHEIITLQLGQQSNYLATHFWNAQEAYFTYTEGEESPVDHDVHWRAGLAADATTETFMPRTVIYDLKGGFGSLRRINALYDATGGGNEPQALWNGPTTLQTAPPIPPSEYQTSLDSGTTPPRLTPSAVRFWSDVSRVYFHPRSVVQLSEYELHSALNPFERFAAGEDLFAELDREHDLLDRDLRLFVEEADQMQGIQVFGGLDDAWGGFGARYLERIRDEYGKTAVWVWGVEGDGLGGNREKRLLRLANKARAMVEAYKQATIIVPLALPRSLPPSVALDSASAWHTSALLASAIETATLPSRLKDASNRDSLSGMAEVLNSMGKQTIAGLQMSFGPSPPPQDTDSRDPSSRKAKLTDEELAEGMSLDVRFTPSDQVDPSHYQARRNGYSRKTNKVFSQLVALRGYPPPPDEDGQDGEDEVMDRDDRDHRRRQRRRRRNPDEPVTKSYTSSLRFPLLDSFPPIFRDPNGGPLTGHINATTSLSTDSSVSDRLKLLRTTVTRSIGLEDREMIGNDLAEMADEYHEGWSSGSDDGDDD